MSLPSPPPWWASLLSAKARQSGKILRYLAESRVEASQIPCFEGPYFPIFQNYGTIRIGDSSRFRSVRFRSSVSTGPVGKVEIGSRCFFNDGINIYSAVGIAIGSDTMLADEAIIFDTTFHAITPDRPAKVAPVTIGRNVWLGARAIVLPGVTIGDHSVIGAGSVVVSDIPPRSIAAGSPARVVRTFECPDDWRRS